MTNGTTNSVQCPTCHYDLRGSWRYGEIFLCPECGDTTTVSRIITAEYLRRQAVRNQIIAGVGALVLATALLAVGRSLGEANLWIGAGAMVIALIATVQWIGTPMHVRGLFVGGVGLGVAILPAISLTGQLLLLCGLVIWWFCFLSWIMKRGFY